MDWGRSGSPGFSRAPPDFRRVAPNFVQVRTNSTRSLGAAFCGRSDQGPLLLQSWCISAQAGKALVGCKEAERFRRTSLVPFPPHYILPSTEKSIIHDLSITFIHQLIIDQTSTRSVSLLLETVVIRWARQHSLSPICIILQNSGGYSQSRTHTARTRSCSISSDQPTTSKFFHSDHQNYIVIDTQSQSKPRRPGSESTLGLCTNKLVIRCPIDFLPIGSMRQTLCPRALVLEYAMHCSTFF